MSATGPLLRTEDLTRRFEGVVAVEGVSFEVPEGELRGIIGPNGAGKTTFFNLITGALAPSAGTIAYRGADITGLSAHKRAQRGIARAYQVTNVFPGLSVEESVLGARNGQKRLLNPIRTSRNDREGRAAVRDVLESVGLADHLETTVENLSHADQKLLDIALVLATDPDLVLLDEPTAGLSTNETGKVKSLIDDLRSEVTILLVEHDMDVVMDLADRITVLHNGQILAEGTPETISDTQRVQEVYFGR
jgi:branched-chain amino acid transport system ATP-binding protein